MSMKEIKTRKSWKSNPATKPHSTPKGMRGYDRSEGRKAERDWRKLLD